MCILEVWDRNDIAEPSKLADEATHLLVIYPDSFLRYITRSVVTTERVELRHLKNSRSENIVN